MVTPNPASEYITTITRTSAHPIPPPAGLRRHSSTIAASNPMNGPTTDTNITTRCTHGIRGTSLSCDISSAAQLRAGVNKSKVHPSR